MSVLEVACLASVGFLHGQDVWAHKDMEQSTNGSFNGPHSCRVRMGAHGMQTSRASSLGVPQIEQVLGGDLCLRAISGRAKGAAKGSCGETVVQKGVFGESVSSLLP